MQFYEHILSGIHWWSRLNDLGDFKGNASFFDRRINLNAEIERNTSALKI